MLPEFRSSYHVIYDSKSYNLEIVSEMRVRRHLFSTERTNYDVQLRDNLIYSLISLGLARDRSKVNNVRRLCRFDHRPGVVEGQLVQAGEPLMILEAMKMENIIKAPADSVVTSVKIKKGDSVEKNQILIEF